MKNFLIVCFLFLVGCDEKIKVGEIYEFDDCIIKEVQLGDFGQTIYLAHCDVKSTSASWNQRVGKTIRTHHTITKDKEK